MDQFKCFTKLEAKIQNKVKLLKNAISKINLRPLLSDFSDLLILISCSLLMSLAPSRGVASS